MARMTNRVADHQGHSDQQVDKHVLDQTGQDEADEGHCGHGQGVGQLGEHVVQMEAVGTGGSHDGGVGDGGQWSPITPPEQAAARPMVHSMGSTS